MSDTIIPSNPTADEATKLELIEAVIAALSSLDGRVSATEGSSFLPNSSFEILDGAGDFANWDVSVTGSGWSVTQAEATVATPNVCVGLGRYSLKALGGGSAGTITITSDMVPVRAGTILVAGAMAGLDSGTCDNFEVRVKYYDSDGVTLLSTVTVYDTSVAGQPALPSTNSSGEMESRYACSRVPDRATYAVLEFYISDSGHNPLIYLDAARMEEFKPVLLPYFYHVDGAGTNALVCDQSTETVHALLPVCFIPVVNSIPVGEHLHTWLDGGWVGLNTEEIGVLFCDPAGRAQLSGGTPSPLLSGWCGI